MARPEVPRAPNRYMVSLDFSIIPAILIFLALIFAMNSILFRPILRIQEERLKRTSGLIEQSKRELEDQQNLFRDYEAKIRQARFEGYQLQEQIRGEAAKKRAETIEGARKDAEKMTEESKALIAAELKAAKEKMAAEARDLASRIAAMILQRSA